MVALSRNVSNKHAMEMLLTGDMIPAKDAYRIGLVNRVVPAGKAAERALELARQIAAKSMLTVKIGKEAFYRQREMNLAALTSRAGEELPSGGDEQGRHRPQRAQDAPASLNEDQAWRPGCRRTCAA